MMSRKYCPHCKKKIEKSVIDRICEEIDTFVDCNVTRPKRLLLGDKQFNELCNELLNDPCMSPKYFGFGKYIYGLHILRVKDEDLLEVIL
jgi:hypothetical protein